MLPIPRNYEIYPAVVPADKSTAMTVVPTEKAFLFFEGEEYVLTVIGMNNDDSYYQVSTHETLSLIAKDGVLRFDHTFADEQEYLLILQYGEKVLAELHVYSLYEDLYQLNPLKGDFHSHSYRSDGKRDPSAEAGHYREQGYDFYALTDHNRYHSGGEIDETYAGLHTGFTRVFGEEVHCPGSVIHIVHVGGKRSVTDRYVHDRENYEREIADYQTRVPAHIPEQYRDRYAKAMWATDEIHKAGGIAIFPHPYWRPGKSRLYNVRDEFAEILLMSGLFDAYELIGGMKRDGNNRSVVLWSELRSKGLNIPVVGSSDVHGMERSEVFPHQFTICFATANENDAIVDAVKQGLSVAVEATGDEYERHYRCYGGLRLVSYAQFLLKYYYPMMQRITHGIGVAMRAYAMSDAPAELVTLQAEYADKVADRYFGKAEPKLPDAAIIAFENKWREVQLNGPITKGSSIDTGIVNRQI
ncbi:MAG: PHP domain-containing protein [Clostridia bacterium]|nr:PHP domain-containing protein [Clostridia bacterium]